MGFLDSVKKIFSNPDVTQNIAAENDKIRLMYSKRVEKINVLEPVMETLSDGELRNKTDAFRSRLQSGESMDDLLVEAFAVVREASWRVLKLRHFDVQVRAVSCFILP